MRAVRIMVVVGCADVLRTCGEERIFFLPTSGALFLGPSTVSRKIITFLWSDSSGSSGLVLFLNVFVWFQIMTPRITRYCKSHCN